MRTIGNVIYVPSIDDTSLPDIQNEGSVRLWIIRVALSDILDFVAAKTVSDSRRNPDSGTAHILRDEDKDILIAQMQEGVSNVYMVLARRMREMPIITTSGFEFRLEVSENHDDNAANILYMRIMDYLQEYAYYKWANVNTDNLERKLNEIRSAMHYRKHGITRKINGI